MRMNIFKHLPRPTSWNVLQTRCNSSYKMANILKLAGFKLQAENYDQATVRTGGFQFGDYDLKRSLPSCYSMLQLVQASAVFMSTTSLDESGERSFRDYRDVMSSRLPFILMSRLDINRSMYDPLLPKAPLDITLTGGIPGNTSDSISAAISTTSGLELARNPVLFVGVDMKTRQPTPFPDWWKEKYANPKGTCEILNFKKMSRPRDALKYVYRIVGSDVDSHGHTNYAYYLRFAEDAIYHFVQRTERFRDINYGRVQTIEMLNGSESFEGDFLDIYVWRLDSNRKQQVVCAQIFKELAFVSQSRFVYFEN